jgi:hypothetical protein
MRVTVRRSPPDALRLITETGSSALDRGRLMFSPATTGCFRVDTGYSPADQRTVAVRTLTIEQPPSGTPPVCRPDTRRSRAKPISCGPTSPPSSAASRSSWSRWPGCRRGSSCGARSSLGCGGFGDHHCLGFGLLLDRGVSPRLAVKKNGPISEMPQAFLTGGLRSSTRTRPDGEVTPEAVARCTGDQERTLRPIPC